MFLPPDRYVVFASVTGQWGGHDTEERLNGAPGTFSTLHAGTYKALVDFTREFQGPVYMTRVATENDRLKVTLSFLENKTPVSVSVTTMCRGGELALIHEMIKIRGS